MEYNPSANSADHEASERLLGCFDRVLKNELSYYFELEEYGMLVHHYLRKNDYDKALQACNLAGKQYPYSLESLQLKAEALLQAEREEELLTILESNKGKFPNCKELLFMKVEALASLKRFKEAVSLIDEIDISGYDTDSSFLFQLGNLYQMTLNIDKAILYFKKGLAKNPRDDVSLYRLTQCLVDNDLLAEHLDFYEENVDQNPYSARSWHYLGMVYESTRQFDKAGPAYEYSCLVDKNYAAGYLSWGNLHTMKGEHERAIEIYNQGLKSMGPCGLMYYGLGCIYEVKEEIDKAIMYFKEASSMKEMKKYEKVWFRIAVCFLRQERWYEATHFLNKAVEVDRNNVSYWKLLAETEYELGNMTSCLEAYQTAYALDSSDETTLLAWADVLYELGYTGKAISILERGIDEHKLEASVFYRLAGYLMEEGRYKDGMDRLGGGLKLNYSGYARFEKNFPNIASQPFLKKVIEGYRPKESQ